jgi:hypothetical protein
MYYTSYKHCTTHLTFKIVKIPDASEVQLFDGIWK